MTRHVTAPPPATLDELLERSVVRIAGLDAEEEAYRESHSEVCRLVHGLLMYCAGKEGVEVLEELDDCMRKEYYRRKRMDSDRNANA